MDLTGKQKRYLRSLANRLKPVVQIGKGGVSTALVTKVSAELENHELIKVKVGQEAPLDAKEAAAELAEETGAAVAQVIGRTVVLYRPREEEPTIRLP